MHGPDPSETLISFVDEGDPVDQAGAVDTLPPGNDRIAGRYEILGLLGVGGMGSVYRVRDLELDETVALKRLRRELVTAPGAVARLRQEVKLARRVTHPNVVRTFDLGEHGDERFLTMEWIDGHSLSQALACRGAFPADRVVAFGRQLCAGLSAAHRAGVLHRDLKPDNVLVTRDGRVVITDFGIARAAAEAGATRAGLVGTPAYMAPEQVEAGGRIDARADQYALGAVLYEILTGERAWPGDEVFPVALARLTRPPPDPRSRKPDLPSRMADLVVRCMARSPEDRFPDVDAVAEALAAMGGSAGPLATAPGRTVRSPEADAHLLAVLPLSCGTDDDAWIAEGLTEELIDALSMTPGLRVRPLSAVAGLDGTDPRRAGADLGVTVVVTGSVRRAGEQIRLSVRLLSVADGYQVWARRATSAPSAALALSDQLAEEIAGALTVQLTGPRREQSEDPVAVELYLKGRAASRRNWQLDMSEAVALLAAARERAPAHPSILAAHATALARHGFASRADAQGALLEQAGDAARRAVQAGPELGEPWMALATVQLYRGDSAGAYKAVRTALARAPGVARAHELQGMLLFEAKRLEEAEASLRTAISLDPGGQQARWELARLCALQGRWSEADTLLAEPVEESQRFALALVELRLDLWRGRPTTVDLEIFRRSGAVEATVILQIADLHARLVRERQMVPGLVELSELRASAARGRQRWVILQSTAEALAFVGDSAGALARIRTAVDEGLQDLAWMDLCPPLAPVREQPEWAALRATVAGRAASVADQTVGTTG